MRTSRLSVVASIVAAALVTAVTASANDGKAATDKTQTATLAQPSGTAVNPPQTSPLYRLGPGDEIRVQQLNDEELDGKAARVDDQGFVNLPSVGRMQVGGLTVQQAESVVSTALKSLLVNPQPVIAITEYRSQPVSVLGAVNNPGIIQLQGRKTLVEALSMAGGLRADAGTEVQVTRRLTYGHLPLPNETTDPSNEYSIAKVNLAALLKGNDPNNNITVDPQDIISVPRAESVYVTGDVVKPGGFPLTGNGGVSVLQAVSLAEGLGPQASPKGAKIFRLRQEGASTSDRTEIPVNVEAILAGKSQDFVMKPQDILFIPDSKSKKAGVRAAEAAIQAATGILIWGRF